jgi:hypothetical protein
MTRIALAESARRLRQPLRNIRGFRQNDNALPAGPVLVGDMR